MSKINDIGIFLSINIYNDKCYKVLIFSQDNGIFWTFLKKEKKNKFQVYDLIEFNCDYKEEYNYRNLQVANLKNFCDKIFFDKFLISIFGSISSIVIPLLVEKGDCNIIYRDLQNLLFSLGTTKINIIANYISILLNILDFAGININVFKCAITGLDSTYYISPKTGNYITKKVGEKYKERLFIIPICFKNYTEDLDDLVNAINIIHYFFSKIFRENGILNKFENVKIFRDQIINYIII